MLAAQPDNQKRISSLLILFQANELRCGDRGRDCISTESPQASHVEGSLKAVVVDVKVCSD
ncbi:MAG: hypothetical protein ACI87E_002203 [Mariniblastus sp.]